jgi:D-erythro-7,8-dihydroneopterin triphosphate epimerase
MRDSVYTAQQPASPSLATINIRNLRLRTLIGFNPDEKVKKQDVVLNIEIKYAIGDTVFQDRIEDALNYKVITKKRHPTRGARSVPVT